MIRRSIFNYMMIILLFRGMSINRLLTISQIAYHFHNNCRQVNKEDHSESGSVLFDFLG
jgi:hypothetical protein